MQGSITEIKSTGAMSKLNEDIQDLIEDLHKFLTCTLASESLASSAVLHKNGLLIKVNKFQQDYPEIMQPLDSRPNEEKSSAISASPPPYLEMKGQAPPQFPVLENLPSNAEEEYYEEYGSEEVSTKDNTTENKSPAESEATSLDEGSGSGQAVPEMPATDLVDAEKSGYLEKKGKERLGGLLNPFQKRWCAIKNSILYYYINPNDRKQKGHIDLNGYDARPAPTAIKDVNKKNCCFEIICPGKPTFQFIAITVKDMKQWVAAVEKLNHDLYPKSQVVNVCDPIPESKPPERASMRKPSEKVIEIVVAPPPVNNDTDDELYECVAEKKIESEELYEEGESWAGHEPEEVYVDADVEGSFRSEDWYVGLWDCQGSGELELDFKRGEMIQIIDKSYDKYAWWTGKLGSKVGLVPKAYLMEAYEQT